MKRIYATVVHRTLSASETRRGDSLYVLDWDRGCVLAHAPVSGVTDSISAHSGALTHGARGIAIHNNLLYVAGSTRTISVYRLTDESPILLHSFDIPGASALHQIRFRGGLLYVASTGDDSMYILRDDVVMKRVYLPDFIDIEKIDSLIAGKDRDRIYGQDRLYFNSLAWNDAGELLHVYMVPECVYNVDRRQVLPFHRTLCQPHDVALWDGWTVVNSSQDRATLAVTTDQRCSVIYKGYGQATVPTVNHLGYTRGLQVHGGSLFAGAAPLTIREFTRDAHGIKLMSSWGFSFDPTASLYDFVLDPRDWD